MKDAAVFLDFTSEVLEFLIKNHRLPETNKKALHDSLIEKKGIFIKLVHKESGKSLGTEGHITADRAVYLNIRDILMQLVKGKDLSGTTPEDYQIVLSFPSPIKSCKDTTTVKLGEQGVFFRYMELFSTVLPQEPKENGWDLAETLDVLIKRAGLNPTLFDWDNALFFTFTTDKITS